MFNISVYLEKFKNIGLGEKRLKELVVLSIKEVTGIVLETKSVDFKNGDIVLSASPAIKNTIYIKKEKILENLKNRTAKNILNIR